MQRGRLGWLRCGLTGTPDLVTPWTMNVFNRASAGLLQHTVLDSGRWPAPRRESGRTVFPGVDGHVNIAGSPLAREWHLAWPNATYLTDGTSRPWTQIGRREALTKANPR